MTKIAPQNSAKTILYFLGYKIILDYHLAKHYKVEIGLLKQHIKRNLVKEILFLFSIIFLLMSCQEKNDSFEIKGRLSADIDSIHIYPGFVAKEYIDTTLFDFSSKINNGEFVFKGKMPYPHMMNLLSQKVGMSHPFFIEKGTTNISLKFIEDLQVRFLDKPKSPTQMEYEQLIIPKLDSIYDRMRHANSVEEMKKHEKQIDLTLINHLKGNPNSYVILWLLIDRFCRADQEYNKTYVDALGHFSSEIQHLPIFKTLKKNLVKNKGFSFANREIPVKAIDETDLIFKAKNFNDKKYLLIDFWYSSCSPCLRQMPKYKPIYDKYKIKGFEIVSISVDESKDITKWKGIIEEMGFNWTHYLDLSGHETKKMKIISYPTTYLIDTKGIVIEKNISPDRLEKFLNESL